MTLTASQLRRKRRDRAWKLWLQRSAEFERRLTKLIRKYFESERGRVVRRLLTRIHLRAAEADEESDDLELLSMTELQKAIEQELQENNDDWDDVLLMLLLLVGLRFTAITVNELGYQMTQFVEQLRRSPEVSIPDSTIAPEVGVSQSPTTLLPAKTETWTRTFVDATLALIAATTLKKIISVIADAQQKKQSTQATITRINDAYSTFVQNRVPGIAGDMVGKVASMAQQLAVLSLGIQPDEVEQTWVSMRDKKVRESHQELDGVTRKIGEEFKPGLKFPRDPNAPIEETINCRCLAPGTRVSGRFVAAMRAEYRGPLRDIITRQGRKLSVTPNHPILTSQGWVESGSIYPGSKLIAYRNQINAAIASMDSVDENQRPSTVEDLFAAFAAFGPVLNPTTTGEYFNRDARFFTSKIDAISIDPDLMLHTLLSGFQDSQEVSLYERTGCLSRSSLRMCFYGVIGQTFPLRQFGLGTSTDVDSVLDKMVCESPAAHLQFIRELFDGIARNVAFDQSSNIGNADARVTSMGHSDHLRASTKCDAIGLQDIHNSVEVCAEESGALFDSCSRLIEIDEVSFVDDRLHDGFVYDLQNPHGLLISEGIVTQNCWLMVEQVRKQRRKAA